MLQRSNFIQHAGHPDTKGPLWAILYTVHGHSSDWLYIWGPIWPLIGVGATRLIISAFDKSFMWSGGQLHVVFCSLDFMDVHGFELFSIFQIYWWIWIPIWLFYPARHSDGKNLLFRFFPTAWFSEQFTRVVRPSRLMDEHDVLGLFTHIWYIWLLLLILSPLSALYVIFWNYMELFVCLLGFY